MPKFVSFFHKKPVRIVLFILLIAYVIALLIWDIACGLTYLGEHDPQGWVFILAAIITIAMGGAVLWTLATGE